MTPQQILLAERVVWLVAFLAMTVAVVAFDGALLVKPDDETAKRSLSEAEEKSRLISTVRSSRCGLARSSSVTPTQ